MRGNEVAEAEGMKLVDDHVPVWRGEGRLSCVSSNNESHRRKGKSTRLPIPPARRE